MGTILAPPAVFPLYEAWFFHSESENVEGNRVKKENSKNVLLISAQAENDSTFALKILFIVNVNASV